ncbi:DegT/DnrJ/EryC1/StrS family aminotransferase, partial [Candidatus Micrarchaeota archaeon]|nr:DegT/DnrJ/EryC1/StrS family aminotransferase [Candidatus Micrarchaeota archaeon]
EAAITSKTAAILPVHLYGQPAEMKEILSIAKKHGLKVIEDACQAHGSAYGGKKAGSMGDAAAFSFFPTKNMTVFGDGGMITTNDAEAAKKARMLRDNGRLEAKDDCNIFGMNNRLSEIMAAVGREQLKRLDGFNRRRIELAKLYREQLEGVGDITLPGAAQGRTHIYHLYTIRTKRRDALKDALKKNNVECSVMYPILIPNMTAYRNAGYKCSLPVAERLAGEILSIPMHPELTDSEVLQVCEVIKGFYKG